MNKFKNHLIALTAVRRIDMRTKVHFATTLTTLLLLLFTSVGPYLPPPGPVGIRCRRERSTRPAGFRHYPGGSGRGRSRRRHPRGGGHLQRERRRHYL